MKPKLRHLGRRSNPSTGHPIAEALAVMVRQTQDDNRDVVATMPNKATTAGQRALQKKHGTPRQFADACVNAIGEISPLDAHRAIRKYLDEWERA